jgi:hypothetical protein
MKELLVLLKDIYNKFRGKDSAEKLNKWDISLYLLIAFLLIYSLVIALNYEKLFSWHLKEPGINLPNVQQYITNIPVEEFQIGDVVGIRYFNIYGLVTERTRGIGKISYEVLYKDGNRDLQKINVEGWLLYHPPKESLSPLILQN